MVVNSRFRINPYVLDVGAHCFSINPQLALQKAELDNQEISEKLRTKGQQQVVLKRFTINSPKKLQLPKPTLLILDLLTSEDTLILAPTSELGTKASTQ